VYNQSDYTINVTIAYYSQS